MKKRTLLLAILLAFCMAGCDETQLPSMPTTLPVQTDPDPTQDTTVPPAIGEPVSQINDAEYVLIEDAVPEMASDTSQFILIEGENNGPIRADYIRLPMDTAVARQPYEAGVFWVAEDSQEMNQGNRYRGYVMENGQLVQLETKEFKAEYTVLGRTVMLELAYVLHEGELLLSYAPATQSQFPRATIWSTAGGVHACVVLFEFEEDGNCFSYCAAIDLESGEMNDILGGFDPALFEELPYAPERWDGRTLVLSCRSANTWLYLDTEKGTAEKYDFNSLLPGVNPEEYCLAGDTLVARAYADSTKVRSNVWQISLTDGSVMQVLSNHPVKAFESELPYLIYLDDEKNLRLLDLTTMEEVVLPEAKTVMSCTAGFVLYKAADGSVCLFDRIEAQADGSVCLFDRIEAQAVRLLPEAGDWIMELRESPDGHSALLYKQDEKAVKQLLIFAGDTDTVIELRRTNLNGTADGFCMQWDENGRIVVGADNRRDFCVYTVS